MATTAQLDAPRPSVHEETLYEVVDGQRVETPPMSIYASWLAARLQNYLGPFADKQKLGTVVTEALFILDVAKDLRRRPDVAFVSAERWPLDCPVPVAGDWNVVPDLAVEIVSPHDKFEDTIAKMTEYFAHGVVQVWIISPTARRVFVFDGPTQVGVVSLTGDLHGGNLLPGFRLSMTELFKVKETANGTPE